MAKTIIELPHVGESVTEGVIAKWLVEPGQHVRKYGPLVEVMTDKVNMEVPSPYAGILLRTLVNEGDTVPMGQAIAEMDVEGAVPSQAPSQPQAAANGPVVAKTTFEFVDSVRSVGPTGSGEGGQGRLIRREPLYVCAVDSLVLQSNRVEGHEVDVLEVRVRVDDPVFELVQLGAHQAACTLDQALGHQHRLQPVFPAPDVAVHRLGGGRRHEVGVGRVLLPDSLHFRGLSFVSNARLF